MNGSAARPAVTCSANVAMVMQQPDEQHDVVAVPVLRPEDPQPGDQHRDEEPGEQQPAAERGEVRALRRRARGRWIRARSTSVTLSPPRTMTSPWTMCSMTGSDGRRLAIALLLGQRRAERAVRDQQRRDQLGGEDPLAVRRGRRPSAPRAARAPAPPPCPSARSRSVTSRTRAASVRIGAQRSGSSVHGPWRARRRTGPGSTASSSAWRSSAVVSGANAVSSGADAPAERARAAPRRS